MRIAQIIGQRRSLRGGWSPVGRDANPGLGIFGSSGSEATRARSERGRQASTGAHLEPIEHTLHVCASQASHIPSTDLSLLYALAIAARTRGYAPAIAARIRLPHDRRFVSRLACRAI